LLQTVLRRRRRTTTTTPTVNKKKGNSELTTAIETLRQIQNYKQLCSNCGRFCNERTFVNETYYSQELRCKRVAKLLREAGKRVESLKFCLNMKVLLIMSIGFLGDLCNIFFS